MPAFGWAPVIRKYIFNHEGILFNRSFSEKCQDKSLPSSHKTLISLILKGSNLKNQEKQESQACLTIGQAIVFNTKKRSTAGPEAKPRHSLEREPPLPVYIGLNIHGLTRSKHLINQLHQLGICISYERVLQLEDWIAKAICIRFHKDGVVSPVCLHRGLFTVGALDNLDHTPSSTTSQSSFHIALVLACSTFHPQTSRNVDRLLQFLPPRVESMFSYLKSTLLSQLQLRQSLALLSQR